MAPISTLTIKLSAQIAEFQSEFREAQRSAEKFADNFEGVATRAATVGTFLGNVATKIASSLASAFTQGISDAIRLSSEFQNAFIGLSSVARAFGTDADAARGAAQRLSADGLLPLKDSATGLKNLLAAGFNLDQSVQLMNAFKDSAAFGRQGALSFGDAIRSATEGVKNGNSILVDNAGVTKNLSQILKEAGYSAQDLSRASSDAGVRMALFNGILKETRAQTGDADRLLQTYSGTIATLDTQWKNLLAVWGDAITQNATVAQALRGVSNAIATMNVSLSDNRRAFHFVSDGVVFLVRAFAELMDVADKVQLTLAGMQIVGDRTFEAFSNIGIAIFKFSERASNLQKYLDPVNFQRHAAAADEARQAYQYLEGVSRDLQQSQQRATDRSITLGNALQVARKKALDLADELKATRGKTVEFGDAAGAAGQALDKGISTGAKNAGTALKKLRSDIDSSLRGLKIGDLASSPGITVDLKRLVSIIPPELPEPGEILTGFQRRMTGAMTSLPGIELDLNKMFPAPKGDAFRSLFNGALSQLSQAFAQLSQVAGDGLADLARQIGTTLAAMDLGAQGGAQMSKGLEGINKGGKAAAAGMVQFAAGLATAVAAMEAATQSTSKLKNTLSGAATGAQIGNSVAPGGSGAIFGAIIGGIYGYIKAEDNAAAARNRARAEASALRQEILRTAGGYDALAERAELAGIDIARVLGADLNVDQVRAGARDLEEAWKRVTDGIATASSGVLARADVFARPFRELVEAMQDGEDGAEDLAAKLAYTAQVGQAEFERLGVFIGATFAGMVRISGDAIGAIKELAPAFQTLNDGVQQFGLQSSGVIDQLRGMFNLVTDQTTGPIIEAIQATGQIFTGLSDAGFMTADLFQTVATDIGASFRELESKGGDVAKAMALSQPVLQRLWEAQQTYGAITDETTAKLLKQAEEQGLVGDHMKDINQKILDVLIAIADVFGATLPEAFRSAASAADTAATDIGNSLGRIRVPPIRIDFDVTQPNLPPMGGNVPQLASGGIVRRPTLAVVGEAGPEAVIPLSRLGSALPEVERGTTTVVLEQDGQRSAEFIVPHIPGVVRRYGLV
jgi:hypothetical protein